MGLTGIAEIDAQRTRANEKTKQCGTSQFGPERDKLLASLGQTGMDRINSGSIHEKPDREDHQHTDHQQPLQEIRPAGCPKTTQSHIDQHDPGPEKNPPLVLHAIEARMKSLACGSKLCCAIQHHRNEDHHD